MEGVQTVSNSDDLSTNLLFFISHNRHRSCVVLRSSMASKKDSIAKEKVCKTCHNSKGKFQRSTAQREGELMLGWTDGRISFKKKGMCLEFERYSTLCSLWNCRHVGVSVLVFLGTK
jgi:hypothetical protein